MAHYADGTPAKHGDLIVLQQGWDKTETILIVTFISSSNDTCNAGAIPLATKQGDAPWFPCGPQGLWTVTLKECMRIDSPAFPPATEVK